MTRRAKPQTTRLPVPVGEIPDFAPVPRKCQRHDGWTPERQRAFIEALADTGSVEAASKIVDMSAVGAYYLRRQPGAESFREAWRKALDLGVQRIEDVAMDRALNGVDEPLYSYGKLIGTRKRYNDRLLMFMLRNRAPERFAAGRPKGMNAVGKMETERLKKEWRAEWEAEQRNVSVAEVRASLDRKVEALRLEHEHAQAKQWERLSAETRRAFDLYERLKARDEARIAAAQDGEASPETHRLPDGENTKPPAGWRAPPVSPPKDKDKHTLKDKSWDSDGAG